jgi:adenine nucleotide transporter 17
MLSVLLAIFKKEGIRGFYRGFGATMINTFSMRTLTIYVVQYDNDANSRHSEYAYFFFYSFVRNSYIKRLVRKLPPGSKAPPLSTAAELLLGAAAGALAQIFTIPVSVIATRQQVGRSPNLYKRTKSAAALPTASSEPEEEIDDSFLGVGREIIEEEGVTGLWLGIKPGLALTVNPAITYGVYERVKSLLLLANGSNPKLTPWVSFLVGALSKTLATIVCCFLNTPCCYLVSH